MANKIGATQTDIFLFLTQHRNWQTEAASIDCNDGIITQNEFGQYITQNWDAGTMGCATPENDLIRKFWNKFDTNTEGFYAGSSTIKNKFALDENEIKNMEKELELYEEFDSYIRNINPPQVLQSTKTQWLRSVKEDLYKCLESYHGEVDKLADYLNQFRKGIENSNTAIYCAVEVLSSVQNDLPEGYSPFDDATLLGILESYCSGILDNTSADTIMYDIKGIIREYLKTANISNNVGGNPNINLNNPNQWNDLQKSIIINKMKEEFFKDGYEEAPELHDKYIGLFLDYLESSNLTFSMVNKTTDMLWGIFENSAPGKKLIAIREVLNAAKNIQWNSEDNSIYQKLIEKLGPEVADIIRMNDTQTTIYQDALDELISKIDSGEITDLGSSNIVNLVVNIIVENLSAFQDNLIQKVPFNNFYAITDEMYKNINFDCGDINKLRQQAIQYCDMLVEKGGKIGIAVIEVFGTTDYEKAINELDGANLKTKMEKLKQKIDDLKSKIQSEEDNEYKDINSVLDPRDSAFAWWGTWPTKTVGTNDTLDLTHWNIHNSPQFKEGALKDYPITYEYSSIGDGTILGSTFNPGNKEGTAKVTVTAKVGNVYISHTIFDVKIVLGNTPSNDGSQEGDPGSSGSPAEEPNMLNLYQLTFKDLDLSANLCGYAYALDFDNAARDAKYDVGTQLKKNVDNLNLSDKDKDIFKDSINNGSWNKYFNNLFDAIKPNDIRPVGNGYNHNKRQSRKVTFQDNNNTEQSVYIAYGSVKRGDDANANKYAKEWALTSSSGVGICKEMNGAWRVAISAKKAFEVLKSYF